MSGLMTFLFYLSRGYWHYPTGARAARWKESLAPSLPSASEVSACYWYGTTDLVWPLVQTIIIINKIQSFHFNMAMWLMSSAAMAGPC